MLHSRLSVARAISVAVIAAAPLLGLAAECTVLPESSRWEAFAPSTGLGSFAWAGEDESFSTRGGMLGMSRLAVDFEEAEADADFLTGLPAPEPPALVLAGLAFGGVLCGRSVLVRRRKTASATNGDNQTPRA